MKYSKLILFLVLAILGAIITPHYGESWDELQFYKYADLALNAYGTWPTQGSIPTYGNTYDNYGPAFVMLVTLAAKPLQVFFSESDARHFLYFLTFLAGILAFHGLAKRWLSANAALFSTLLFVTQPVVFGHAFISPKDIPFLSFFLLALHFGLKAFDTPGQFQLGELDPGSKRTLFVTTALWLAAVFGLYLFTDAIHSRITSLVVSAKDGETNLLSYLATDISKVDPQVYIERYFAAFLWARSFIFLLSSVLLLFFVRRNHPAVLQMLPSILWPGILLGLTTSIRVLGPFVAVFVLYHAFRVHRKQAILPLFLYGFIAAITCYLTWPYLWPNPLGHFMESLAVMSQYPWSGRVLFNGVYYLSTELPYSYLPVLFGIQFTEPVWVLTLLGLAAAAVGSREKRELAAFFAVWFILPLAGFILTRSPLYDNFRQVFFIVPPIFLLAGVILERIRNVKWQVAVITVCLLPGILDGLRLHPYEYVYYNRFIGGLEGAFRKFEMDYWATSYRQAAEYLNEVAPEGADIWVEDPSHIVELYIREDLEVHSYYEPGQTAEYEYVISTSRYNLDLNDYPDGEVIYTIERDHAILTVIKQSSLENQ